MIDSLKPREKAFKIGDQDGLYLYVATTGTKSWRANYKVNGKAKTCTYGRYPDLGLARARELHRAPKLQNAVCRDFEAVFKDWLSVKLPSLKNAKHQIQLAATVERFVLPKIGSKRMDEIKRTDLVSIVKSITDLGIIETADRVAGRIRMVFDYAVDCGDIESHPAIGLSRVIVPRKSVPMPSIKPKEAGRLLHLIHSYPDPVTRLGLLLAAHCFPRDNELRSFRFSDIKRSERVWVIPAEQMKMGIPHVIPLSDQVLKLIPKIGTSDLVLESKSKPGHSISENTLLFALYRLGFKGEMTTHGFRSLASSVLNESGLFPGDVVERQLAHQEKNEVRAAYNRAEYLDQRIKMMQWYSNWLDDQLNQYQKTVKTND